MQILVMNDGETWGGVDGAYIIDITEDQHNRLCEGDNLGELTDTEDSYISITDLLASCRLGTWEPEDDKL